jgi:hypothetical protein
MDLQLARAVAMFAFLSASPPMVLPTREPIILPVDSAIFTHGTLDIVPREIDPHFTIFLVRHGAVFLVVTVAAWAIRDA